MNCVTDTGHVRAVLQPELRKGMRTFSVRVYTETPTLRNSVAATAISMCQKNGMKERSGIQECPREDHKAKKEAQNNMSDDIATLKELKEDKLVLDRILWEMEPKQIMDPIYTINAEGKQEKRILRGYIFYIDKMAGDKPALFLMCHTGSGYAQTVAQIVEIPDELITAALEENKDREYFGMYPINKKIENWLKKECGVQE
jgi:hypothetical protein